MYKQAHKFNKNERLSFGAALRKQERINEVLKLRNKKQKKLKVRKSKKPTLLTKSLNIIRISETIVKRIKE
jgi:hypothetical protein